MNRTRSGVLAPVRLMLLSVGLAAVWIAISLFVGTNSAHADEADSRSPLGNRGSGVVNTTSAPLMNAATAPVEKLAAVAPVVRSTVVGAVGAVEGVEGTDVVQTADAVRVEPISRTLTPVIETADAVIAPAVTPVVAVVAPVVAPVAKAVDHVVDTSAGADMRPNVSDLLGPAPVGTVTTPVADLAVDVSDGATTREPGITPAPTASVGVPAVGTPGGHEAVALSAASAAAASVSPGTTITSWAAELNSGLGVDPIASARPYPDPVPRRPAENRPSALPSLLAGSAAATAGGAAGPPSAAELSSSFTVTLISGALLSRAENDLLPSSLPLELSSTPD